MSSSFFWFILILLVGVFVGYLLARIYFLVRLRQQRRMAVDRSRSVVLGHVNEKIAPLLKDFPYHYKDLVFLGKGVDYIVFDGLSSGNLKRIVFLEIKSGMSTLNKNEKMIRECVRRGDVIYDIWHKN